MGKLTNAFEDIFGGGGREIGNQLVVDGEMRRQHKEVPDVMAQIQVADEGAHKSSFPHTRGQGEAQRREPTLKVLDGGKLTLDDVQSLCRVAVFVQRDDLADPGQNLQGIALRRPQTQTITNGVDVRVHGFPRFSMT